MSLHADILKPPPVHRQTDIGLTQIQTNTHTQAKTRAGGQVVEEDDKVEGEAEEEEEKHYVPYYL